MRITATSTERTEERTRPRGVSAVTAPHSLLSLQRLAGNVAVSQLITGGHLGSQSSITAANRSNVVQRKLDQATRAKAAEVMKKLKDKFGVDEFREENGAEWSASELAKVDAAFSKVDKKDQPLLKGLIIIRTDQFEPIVRRGKTLRPAGRAGSRVMRLADRAFQPDASQTITIILHETGHVIQQRVAEATLPKSDAAVDAETARQKFLEAQGKVAPGKSTSSDDAALRKFIDKLSAVTDAAVDLRSSGKNDPRLAEKTAEEKAKDRAAKQEVLESAKNEADLERVNVPKDAKAWLDLHDRLNEWVEAVENYTKEADKQNLAGFIDVVTKNKLVGRRPAPYPSPFTDYVARSWPDRPEEFFAESFSRWCTNPDYMKSNMRPLFDWFKKGGHRESPSRLEIKLYELGKEVVEELRIKQVHDVLFGQGSDHAQRR